MGENNREKGTLFRRCRDLAANHADHIEPLVTQAMESSLDLADVRGKEFDGTRVLDIILFGVSQQLYASGRTASGVALMDVATDQPIVKAMPSVRPTLQAFCLLHLGQSSERLPELARSLSEVGEGRTFDYFFPLVQALPDLPFEAPDMEAILTYFAGARGDWGFHLCLDPIEAWATRHPGEAAEVARKLVESRPPAHEVFIGPVLTGLAGTSWEVAAPVCEAVRAMPDLAGAALWLDLNLARLGHLPPQAVFNLAAARVADTEAATAGEATAVLVELAKFDGSYREPVRATLHAVFSLARRPEVLFPVVRWMNQDEELIEEFLDYFTDAPAATKDLVDHLDWALARLSRQRPEPVLDFLERWLATHGRSNPSTLQLFSSTYEGLRGSDALLARITRWFVADRQLAVAAAGAINKHGLRSFHGPTVMAWTPETFDIALPRLIYGAVVQPELQAHFLRALLLNPPPELPREMVNAEVRHFVWNYPGTGEDVLLAGVEAYPEATKAMVEQIRDDLASYQDARRRIRKLKELRPNPERRALYHKHFGRKANQEITQGMNEGILGVLMAVTNKVTVTRGDGCYQRIDGLFTDTMWMGEHEQTFELPLGAVVDPDGEEFRRRAVWARAVEGER